MEERVAVTRIRKLDDEVVGRIAAGEVVERPASVLKELVENALDAGATRIAIELEGAGKRLIAVSDDGEGMSPDDALLALESHATSKLRTSEDLHAIATLGFRGEALPAIAAASRLELTTAPRTGGAGVRIRVEDAGRPLREAAGRGPGTTVVARDLFYATPARRKFLKSDATELRRLLDVVLESSLASPVVAFEVRSGGRELLRLPASSSLAARLAGVYGAPYASELLPVETRRGDWALTGLIQPPHACSRARRRQLLVVNGRPIQDRALAQAVLQGYTSTLPSGVHPQWFLLLVVPAESLDVNVHPTKREVRFREAEALFGFVQSAVRHALSGLSSAAGLSSRRGLRSPVLRRTPAVGFGSDSAVRERGPHEKADAGAASPGGNGETSGASGSLDRRDAEVGSGFARPSADQLGLFLNARLRARASGEDDERFRRGGAARAPLLWQLHDTFILAQTGTGLAIIDQHSAHERVLYEALLATFERETPDSQELVFPRTYRLDSSEWNAWEDSRSLFERLGFRVEPFGESTVALRAVPVLDPRFHPEEAFQEILADLAEGRTPASSQHQRLARSIACRAAVKAGQELDPEEMSRLVSELFATPFPAADVHGRPAVVQVTLDELVRRFERA